MINSDPLKTEILTVKLINANFISKTKFNRDQHRAFFIMSFQTDMRSEVY